ncbi:hypothetical protein [Anabaena azotica]|uniref:Uncharacterized protein n=1 Tax=Anabaena azotica FACHB-119 TaxID=947527 RepID=A0ABR8CXA5_9NOST|nr:hypothetical protein [Anabaena azotica]MBD2499442.1 hypothetical protein [Anabaena azotica FACHB-119]
MKSFAKLTSIALLLCSFVYPPFLAEAKASINADGVDQKSVEVEANLINNQTEGILLAQRPYVRRRYRRPYVRRRYRRPYVRRRYIRRPYVRSRYIRRPYVRRRYVRYN